MQRRQLTVRRRGWRSLLWRGWKGRAWCRGCCCLLMTSWSSRCFRTARPFLPRVEPFAHGRVGQGGRGHAAQLVTLRCQHRQGGSAQPGVLLNTIPLISPIPNSVLPIGRLGGGGGGGIGCVGGRVSTHPRAARADPPINPCTHPPARPHHGQLAAGTLCQWGK